MLKMILKAFAIGATMMVPGVSGGSMAMVLSIHKDLIDKMSNFRSDMKNNFIFLALFSLSALSGMFLLSKPIMHLIDAYPIVSMYFFLGLVVGSVPTIYKAADVSKIGIKEILSFTIGFLIVLAVSFIPEGIFTVQELSFTQVIVHIIGGFLVSIGFILPGISFSYLLLILGLYSFIIEKLSNFDILSLIPFGLGFLLGLLVMVKAIEKALSKYPKISYFVILGFLLGSLIPVFPGLPKTAIEAVLSIVVFVIGFIIIFFVSKVEEKKKLR